VRDSRSGLRQTLTAPPRGIASPRPQHDAFDPPASVLDRSRLDLVHPVERASRINSVGLRQPAWTACSDRPSSSARLRCASSTSRPRWVKARRSRVCPWSSEAKVRRPKNPCVSQGGGACWYRRNAGRGPPDIGGLAGPCVGRDSRNWRRRQPAWTAKLIADPTRPPTSVRPADGVASDRSAAHLAPVPARSVMYFVHQM
jgi:hypothetical protein